MKVTRAEKMRQALTLMAELVAEDERGRHRHRLVALPLGHCWNRCPHTGARFLFRRVHGLKAFIVACIVHARIGLKLSTIMAEESLILVLSRSTVLFR